jgi:hypothetical protein
MERGSAAAQMTHPRSTRARSAQPFAASAGSGKRRASDPGIGRRAAFRFAAGPDVMVQCCLFQFDLTGLPTGVVVDSGCVQDLCGRGIGRDRSPWQACAAIGKRYSVNENSNQVNLILSDVMLVGFGVSIGLI